MARSLSAGRRGSSRADARLGCRRRVTSYTDRRRPPPAPRPRPPRRRDDRHRRHHGEVRRRGRPRHPRDLHPAARRARSSSPTSRTSPPTATTASAPQRRRSSSPTRWRRSASPTTGYLGGVRQVPRLRDDGHAADNDDPDCFWRADLLAAATDLVAVHARGAAAGRSSPTTTSAGTATPTTSRRTASRCTPSRSPRRRRSGPTSARRGTSPKIYWTAFPKSFVHAGHRGDEGRGRHQRLRRRWTPTTCRSPSPTTSSPRVVDGRGLRASKMAAMRAHATQISRRGRLLRAVEQHRAREALGVEFFRLVEG